MVRVLHLIAHFCAVVALTVNLYCPGTEAVPVTYLKASPNSEILSSSDGASVIARASPIQVYGRDNSSYCIQVQPSNTANDVAVGGNTSFFSVAFALAEIGQTVNDLFSGQYLCLPSETVCHNTTTATQGASIDSIASEKKIPASIIKNNNCFSNEPNCTLELNQAVCTDQNAHAYDPNVVPPNSTVLSPESANDTSFVHPR